MVSVSTLEQVRRNLEQISDPDQRVLAETMFLLGQALPNVPSKENVVILIHGIKTHAVWQERLAQKLITEAGIEVFPIGYGFLDALSFWCPFFTRKEPINRVLREFRAIRRTYPNANISVVAHSFGTYIMSEILNEETDVEIHRLQLCGSIISLKYRWDKVVSRITGKLVVNDAGTKDYWPVMASLMSWGYGPSGVFGFKTTSVKDRYHDCGHSDFFSDEHMTKYWIPLLLDGQVVLSDWTHSRPSPGIWISFLNWFPLKSLLGLSIVGGLSFKFLG
jgi:hypothetical protein